MRWRAAYVTRRRWIYAGATFATRCYPTHLAKKETGIQTTPKLMVTFRPDEREAEPGGPVETALFLGVREEPSLESTQLRWQVRLHAGDIVQVESAGNAARRNAGPYWLDEVDG
jgi:hypothetical protein